MLSAIRDMLIILVCARLLGRPLLAVWCCFWYSARPWWMYEAECHYAPMTYVQHLALNARYALVWLLGLETDADSEFEAATNRPSAPYRGPQSAPPGRKDDS
jgi:hypothetical protein